MVCWLSLLLLLLLVVVRRLMCVVRCQCLHMWLLSCVGVSSLMSGVRRSLSLLATLFARFVRCMLPAAVIVVLCCVMCIVGWLLFVGVDCVGVLDGAVVVFFADWCLLCVMIVVCHALCADVVVVCVLVVCCCGYVLIVVGR